MERKSCYHDHKPLHVLTEENGVLPQVSDGLTPLVAVSPFPQVTQYLFQETQFFLKGKEQKANQWCGEDIGAMGFDFK